MEVERETGIETGTLTQTETQRETRRLEEEGGLQSKAGQGGQRETEKEPLSTW